MSRLVAVSNRVGSVRGAERAGGLAVALADALRARGGIWFGWSGECSEGGSGVESAQQGNVTVATLDLSHAERDEYYHGFSNRCLWPLFHFRIDLPVFDRRQFEGYLRVNRRMAYALWPLLEKDDLVWVHDYHLLTFAEALREHRASQPLGFFLHIPFPPPELLRTCPHHAQLVRALFSYDLLGFQSEEDVVRFADYVCRDGGGRMSGDRLSAYGRTITVKAYPIGIDTQEFAELAESSTAVRETARMQRTLQGRVQIIGVDRLDYTKGLPQRFDAMERLLENYPDAQGRVELLQIAPISRGEVPEYIDIRAQLESRSGHINGRFGQMDWVPIRYINRTISRRVLAGLYRASRIGLVTPLRDGMNLVAKEYVAAQNPADPGVLILSEFAGAAPQMSAAVLVNPYDVASVAEHLQIARHMPIEERRNRHAELMRGLLKHDIKRWRENYLGDLQNCARPANLSLRVGRM